MTKRKNPDVEIKNIIDTYLNGFPASAYRMFKKMMRTFQDELVIEDLDKSQFYRVRYSKNILTSRYEMFHVPYNSCEIVSNARYSIAGYPSLYIGDDINTCLMEIKKHYSPKDSNNYYISKLILNDKPENYRNKQIKACIIDVSNNNSELSTLFNFCNSYTNYNDEASFNKDYIIPQLLMQWLRNNIKDEKGETKHICGIKYKPQNGNGYSYVFPTNKEKGLPFCPYLIRLFSISNPIQFNVTNGQIKNIDEIKEQLDKAEIYQIKNKRYKD